MSRIVQLPPHLVNKIAAGEVIERPASVVKELMENALDAGATRIDVALKQGGVELVRVVDNGCGLAADELLPAVTSHATSKIRSEADLEHISTLGFRGEALASIASISRLAIRSRQPDAAGGTELEVVGGGIGDVLPCGAPVGTLIEANDLFFNTPVRRKFLRSTQTEMGYASEAFTRLALGCPGVHCTLTHNERTLFDLPPVDDWRDRIAALFDRQLADGLISVESVEGPVRLSGYVAHPDQSRPNGRMQYLLLNGRAIRDRSLQHALSEAYRGLLLTGRFPICFLRLTLPPEMVDVNVHPTKLEVRFQDGGRLYSQLLGTLRAKFLSSDLTARMRGPVGTERPTEDEAQVTRLRQGVVDWATAALAQAGQGASTALLGSGSTGLAGPAIPLPVSSVSGPGGLDSLEPQLTMHRLDPADVRWRPESRRAPVENTNQQDAEGAATAPVGVTAEALLSSPTAIQVLDRYLVAETPEGMVVIDQHALHERILYEEIRRKVLAGQVERQNLLVPEPVDLAPAEAAAVLEAAELLRQLGIAVSPFGGGTVLVESYPAMLANFRPAELLRSLSDQLLAGDRAPQRRDLLDSLMHMIACKAAIKAGDRLSGEEIMALLGQRELAQDAHHCPHGRPTALVFSREELDRQFKRT
ncbi:MAG: DNA mismatch repair endonuclease MutL [Planctomycetia bacterium]|nr:DNA mismatch repair endonuclease MutL [Planctomycetia bacterium]